MAPVPQTLAHEAGIKWVGHSLLTARSSHLELPLPSDVFTAKEEVSGL